MSEPSALSAASPLEIRRVRPEEYDETGTLVEAAYTAGGILASLTGLYPDRNGQTVSNSYDYYKANGVPTFTSSFKYWTDTVDGTDDSLPNMVSDGAQTTPAPWLTYTAAGCNVGTPFAL